MSQGVPRAILTHSQRVCRLYKKALRTMEMHVNHRSKKKYHVISHSSKWPLRYIFHLLV